jgi:hypothetical protein
MLNGPCHIHSAFVDGKRVSRHAMKDCTTFLKLQEATQNKQTEARRQGFEGNNNPLTNQQGNNGAPQCRWISCHKNTGYHATDPKIRTQEAERVRPWIATKHGDGRLDVERATHCRERDRALPRFRALMVR